MKKGKLIKAGKYWKAKSLDDNKIIPIYGNFELPEDANGKDIEFDNTGGPIKKILLEGNEFTKQQQSQPIRNQNNPQRGYGNNRENNYNESAKSPYNFVPLNDKVIYPEEQKVIVDTYSANRNTGYLEINVENLTHLMVSSGKDKNNIHDFIRIGKDKTPIIPGSSLRGLSRNLVEIVSYSRMIEEENYENKFLYYRGVADKAFTSIYQPKFLNKGDDNDYLAHAGYIRKKRDHNFEIIPANKESGTQYYKINSTVIIENNKSVFQILGNRYYPYSISNIYFKPQPKKSYTHNRVRNRREESYQLKYAKVTDISASPVSGMISGKLIITGGMARNKHFQWIMNLKSDALPIPVNKEIIIGYKKDINREQQNNIQDNYHFNVLDKITNTNPEIPCFYLTNEKGEITEIGHTPLFRIRHDNKISAAINQSTGINVFDLTQLIFGEKTQFASRVFFEDLLLNNFSNNKLEDAIPAKTLASPKPTSHQLYLDQDSSPLKHWSSNNIKINGYKLYWHRKTSVNDWKESGPITNSHPGKLKALKPNNSFTGCIRFENLTDIELGALLFALELPEGCCHKLGMGKPLGLGTVKITPTLHLDDRKKRYGTLLSEDDGTWSLPPLETDKDFKKFFSDYMLEKLNKKKTSLWEVDRIADLKIMLEYDDLKSASPDWLNETAYMQLKDPRFRNRAVLPKPSEVKKKINP